MYAGRFRTIVFTRRKIIRFFIYFISGMLAAVCSVLVCSHISDTSIRTVDVASGNLYLAILENELPVQSEKKAGFDLKNPKSILSYYSSIFDNVKKPEIAQTPVPEAAEPTPSESDSITVAGDMKISNATNYNIDLNELAQQNLPFELDDKGPQVLIMHTHTTESYNSTYSSGDRTTDEEKNIIAVGRVIAEILNNNGINAVHDTTVHDYPSYNGAYTRALSTIKENLAKYPSVKLVLDVHRDGIVREDGTKVKVLTEINNEPCAQIMIVAGSDASGLAHESWKENMKLAAKIQKEASIVYPSLMRPVNLREERFNTHLTKGSIILEVGSNGNTLDEAKRGAEYLSQILCNVLKK